MTEENKDGNPTIIPPNGQDIDSDDLKAIILAQISNYTDRPDLLLEAMEKHDPGFISRMNAQMEATNSKSEAGRYNFGRFQAYLGALICAAIACVLGFCMVWMFIKGTPSFGVILALAIFFAIAMSGTAGFMQITRSVAKAVSKSNPDN